MTNGTENLGKRKKHSEHPFRGAVVRGLGVVSPPLLTIVIFFWIGGTINQYVLRPCTDGARDILVWQLRDIRDAAPAGKTAPRADAVSNPKEYYYKTPDDKYVPLLVYDRVRRDHGAGPLPETAEGVYQRYVELTYLQPYKVVPTFLAIFVLVLYLLGKFMAARIGRMAVGTFERVIAQLPLVRNVYSAVKQVSDFLFSPSEFEFTRVIAVEYPRMGIWSLGFVTGESFADVETAANEPVLSVLVPTSPMPVTGYTINVKKSEVLDLNITIDQAIQFIVSCGVVCPPRALEEAIEAKALADKKEE